MSDSASGFDPLARLADDFLARCRRGERPALTEYTARHPELAGQIRELFPALAMMEDIRPVPSGAAGAAGAEAVPRCLGEYRIVREIGRGGMGVVYEAEQESLGRRVALKVLPAAIAAYPRHVQRFQREARAAARLHHTNIVPVFVVGEQDGTHFYVMQYIEGRSLNEVTAELRRLRDAARRRAGPAPDRESSAPDGAASSADVARSLWEGRFRAADPQEAAQAGDPDTSTQLDVAARAPAAQTPDPLPKALRTPGSSGLLSNPHRSYAMSVAQVGVQAADALEYAAGQGVLHRDVKPSNLLLDVWGTVWLTDFGLAKASWTPDITCTGDLVGTLHYMAPERFQGRADVRSDVYALGLTLYEMLALCPAFAATGQAQLIGQITLGEPPRLERLDPKLPRDLVTIVHKAMARDPADRYQTAGALAEDLRRFLDDRTIQARRVRLPEQVWRWCRRNPTMTCLLTALLASLLLATGGSVWLVQQHAERQAEAARQEQALRKDVETALAQAVTFRKGFHFREGRELLEQARQRLEPGGPDDLRQRLVQARIDLDLAERLDAARLRLATLVEAKFDFAGGERLYEAALADAGLGRPGDDSEALAARVRHSAVREEIVAALDHWASITKDRARQAWLLAVARAADRHPLRDRLRQPELWQDGAQMKQLAEQAKVEEMSPQLVTALGAVLSRQEQDAIPLLTAACARFPNDFWCNFKLGANLVQARRWDEAVGYYRAALALRPKVSAVHNNLGVALAHKGQLDKAIEYYEEALKLDPKNPFPHNNIGIVLHQKGRLHEAVEHFQQSLQLGPKYAKMHFNFGRTLEAVGRLDEAIAEYRETLRLEGGSSLAHFKLGSALYHKGELDGAIDQLQQGLRLDPNDAPAQNNLGLALFRKGRLDEAITHLQQAVQLDPKHPQGHNNLGYALYTKGRMVEALDHLQQAVQLDATNAQAHNNLGLALAAGGRTDEAIDHFGLAVLLDPEYAKAYGNLGLALMTKGRADEAIEYLQQAVQLDPKLAHAHCNLGLAFQKQGRFAEAVASLKLGHELGSKEADWPHPSAKWLQEAEVLAALEARLPAVLQGKDKPASAIELLKFIHHSMGTKRYAAAAQLFSRLLVNPKWAGDLKAGHRFFAACCAARAGTGQGADAAPLDESERAHWRLQALDWLRADLAAWAKATDRALLQQRLKFWQQYPALSAVRDEEALARLPRTERGHWRQLWFGVAALLQGGEKRPQLDGHR
jgi:serine/threonine protein kinase/Flp pilus assembly protein TadD